MPVFFLKLHHRGERGRKGRVVLISKQRTQNLRPKDYLESCTVHKTKAIALTRSRKRSYLAAALPFRDSEPVAIFGPLYTSSPPNPLPPPPVTRRPSNLLPSGIGCARGLPDMMSASEGGVESLKRGRRREDCMNFIV